MKKLFLLAFILPSMAFARWECVDSMLLCHTWRMWVPTGWVVEGIEGSGEGALAMTFVPDPDHKWKI